MWPGVFAINWLVPWHPIFDGSPDDGTARELYGEVGPRHVLHGIRARAVAHRQDCDDVLFELLDGTERFAVVHLTFGRHPDQFPQYPSTEIYANWTEFVDRRMKPDALDWGDEEQPHNLGVRVDQVHVFISTGRFRSFEDMSDFIDETYTEDGDGIPSAFMTEVGLTDYEPGCIEAIHRDAPMLLTTLLMGASYADQWLPQLDGSLTADSAICLFSPNQAHRPDGSSLHYVGAFRYRVR